MKLKFTNETPEQVIPVNGETKLVFGDFNFVKGCENAISDVMKLSFEIPKINKKGKKEYSKDVKLISFGRYTDQTRNPKVISLKNESTIDILNKCDKIVMSFDIETPFEINVSIELH